MLKPFWPADPGQFVFSPRRAVETLHAARTAARKTPRYPSGAKRVQRVPKPKRVPAERYKVSSYGHAVAKGVERANARQAELAGGGGVDPVPHWFPNQLRHAHGTLVRRRFGLEAAQVVLGHERADVTQVYAEANLDLAVQVAAAVG